MKSSPLQTAHNLQQLGAEAMQSKRPLLLIFTQDHCDFCHRLKEEILNPMQLSEKDRNRVLMRELRIDADAYYTNFDGNKIDGSDLFYYYNLVVTPTILLLDGDGKPFGEPLVGVNTIEMYGWYLNNAIDDARDQIMSRKGTQ